MKLGNFSTDRSPPAAAGNHGIITDSSSHICLSFQVTVKFMDSDPDVNELLRPVTVVALTSQGRNILWKCGSRCGRDIQNNWLSGFLFYFKSSDSRATDVAKLELHVLVCKLFFFSTRRSLFGFVMGRGMPWDDMSRMVHWSNDSQRYQPCLHPIFSLFQGLSSFFFCATF